MSVLTQSAYGGYCGVNYAFVSTTYSIYTGSNLQVDILNFGMSSAFVMDTTSLLNLKISIKPVGTLTFTWSGYDVYPFIRVYI